ncbi:hypothetical protein PMAYCL1PPCAC_22179, partial [Pristionchus mayeri]
VEVCAKIISTNCIRDKLRGIDYDSCVHSPLGDNITLQFDNGAMQVCRKLLVWNSPYFASIFRSDEILEKIEFEIEGVMIEDLAKLIHVISPSERPVHVDSSTILTLARRFQVERAFEVVEQFLMNTKTVKPAKKMLLAEQYQMKSLAKHLISSFKTSKQIKDLEGEDEFDELSISLKSAILTKILELI